MNSSIACWGVRVTEVRGRPTCAMLWTSSASAWRTPEKFWLRSAGTSDKLALLGARRQAEGDPRLVDFFQGLLDQGIGNLLGLATLIELLPGDRIAAEECLRPLRSAWARSRVASLLFRAATRALRRAIWSSTCSIDVWSFHLWLRARPRMPRTWASAAC